MMKTRLKLLALVVILLVCGCGEKEAPAPTKEQPLTDIPEVGPADGLRVITTLFPVFDFTREVGREKVNVKLILPPGIEPHAFEPSPKDIVMISKADMLVYTGEAMEPWARRVQRSLDKSIMVVDASKGITFSESASKAGDDGHSHGDQHVCATCSSANVDPHIWLDFSRAQKMVDTIADGLASRDPENSAFYAANAAAYKKKLQELDERTRATLAKCKHKTIFSGGHFAFSYFVGRYGLSHASPYDGFSPDAEPSPQAVGALIQRIKKGGTKAIFYEEMLEPSVAKVISEETGAKLLLLHAGHNLSKDELGRGETFLSIMEGNLDRLKDGLEYQGEQP